MKKYTIDELNLKNKFDRELAESWWNERDAISIEEIFKLNTSYYNILWIIEKLKLTVGGLKTYDGTVIYTKDGKPHRDCDEPAIIHTDGTVEFRIEGEFIKKYKQTIIDRILSLIEDDNNITYNEALLSLTEYKTYTKIDVLSIKSEDYKYELICKLFEKGYEKFTIHDIITLDLNDNFLKWVIKNLRATIGNVRFKDNSTRFFVDGELHRDGDLPAYTKPCSKSNGLITAYLIKGLRHRDGDKPAVDNPDLDYKAWFKHGNIEKEMKNGELLHQSTHL